MIFTETALKGAFIIELEQLADERGFFARSFCRSEFRSRGLEPCIEQCDISFNRKRATLRGMHYQIAPHSETKVVRCTMGAIYDVIVDLRPGSPTLYRWISMELTAENRKMLYVPEGFAHGFQTLMDNTEVFYQISAAFQADAARGIRWDDPVIGIEWPLPDPIISSRDRSFSSISDSGDSGRP